ncbi:MAG: xanthine phosphoribosyltransferase [Christensenellales bacterium]
MEILEQRILKDGAVKEGGILKVDSFLNHQCDIGLYNEMGKAFAAHFKEKHITKILTIEASGIGIACIAAQYFDCPVVFAKKAKSLNLDGSLYTAKVHSYTYDKDYSITVSSKFITKEDTVLLIDDFLANGQAMLGLIDIVRQSGATLAGIGIAIEKGFQSGGERLRKMGIDVCSLAIIDEMRPGYIAFRKS